ncbi:MAG: VTT domain-containing protein [Acidobacteriales bacterium]|nr:VTT domain-containing protein [Terriglobales bacterium]
MRTTFHFLLQHGYAVLFVWVLAEQLGLPIPTIPILMAAGALIAGGYMDLSSVLVLSVTACLLADYLWYDLGRRRGMRVLNLLCRISLEPDTCVRKTEAAWGNLGARSILIAKFVPGLNTAVPPLSGIFGISTARFLAYDALGALLYLGSFVMLGYLFSAQVELVAERILTLSGSLAKAFALLFTIYIGWKFLKRQLFLRELRILRLDPPALKKMMDEGEPVFIVDLRHPQDFRAEPRSIAGALRMSPDEIEEKHELIPRDRDIILFCT